MTAEKGITRRRSKRRAKKSEFVRVCGAREQCSAINEVIHKLRRKSSGIFVRENQLIFISKLKIKKPKKISPFFGIRRGFCSEQRNDEENQFWEQSETSTKTKMGLLLSIFFSYVGAVEVAFIVRDIVHQVGLHQRHIEANRSRDGLQQIQQNIRDSLNLARRRSESCNGDVNTPMQLMQDGVQYENGYRVASVEDLAAGERWMEARNAKVAADLECANPSSDDEHVVSDHSSQDNSSKTVLENESWTFIEREKQSADTGYPKSPNNEEESSDGGDHTSRLVSPVSSSVNEIPDIHFDEYSDAQMRALDGIKQRPLVRDDGTRRRRAFKKSDSSTSSSDDKHEMRKSREEELKMFTSLEEEEFEMIKNSDYKPLQYSSEPNLKTKRHVKRHNRSPMRRSHDSEDDEYDKNDNYSIRARDGKDEINDPWGDVKPDHFHDSELWKRERAVSIAENDMDSANEEDFVRSSPKSFQKDIVRRLDDEGRSYSPVGLKNTKSSSFEAATESDHERVTDMLKNAGPSANAGVSSFVSPNRVNCEK